MLRLIILVALATGCPEQIQTYQMESCAKTCSDNGGVRMVTGTSCECAGRNPSPPPRATGRSG